MSEGSIIRAFGAEHVVRLTGLSKRQLTYWDQTGFFSPRYAFENRSSPHSRIYSFKDVVGLRIISVLRKNYQIPLQHLREAAKTLSSYSETPWADLTLFVFGKEVHFREPDTALVRGVKSKQYVNLPLRSIIEDVAERSNKLRERRAEQYGKLERNRLVAHNAWVISGTRIPTRTVRRFRDAGFAADAIIREYPLLTEKDVRAALKHEAKRKTAA